jgi:hypothetical protein
MPSGRVSQVLASRVTVWGAAPRSQVALAASYRKAIPVPWPPRRYRQLLSAEPLEPSGRPSPSFGPEDQD